MDGFSFEFFGEDGFVFVKVFVDNDGGGFDVFSFGESGIGVDIEGVVVVEFFSDGRESFVGGFVGGVDVGDDDDFVGFFEFF